jgi:hypothetical protein
MQDQGAVIEIVTKRSETKDQDDEDGGDKKPTDPFTNYIGSGD